MSNSPVDGEPMSERTFNMLVGLTASVAAIQQQIVGVSGEQSAVRDRLHDLATQLQPLMVIPERFKDMSRQHEDLKKQIEDMLVRFRLLEPLPDRVAKLEPKVENLVATQNQIRGAGWAGKTLIGALWGLVIAIFAALASEYFKHS